MKTQIETQQHSSFLGNYLLAKKLITPEDLQKATAFQKRIGGRLGSILTRIGSISEDNLLQVLSELLHMQIVADQNIPDAPHIFRHMIEQSGIEADWWLDQEVLAWEAQSGLIYCAARDPMNDSIAEVLDRAFPEHQIEFVLIRNYDLDRALENVSRSGAGASHTENNDIAQLRELAEEAPVVEFVNNLLSQAFDQGASDVHIEPGEHVLEIRFRIDGVLYNRFTLPRERFPAIASRIKLISGMDIAERRLPQDGRLGIRLSGEETDIRVSAVPGVHGESLVLRLLSKEKQRFALRNLGLEPDHYDLFLKWIREPHGIILVTGPTGSGKSTTLYAALDAVNDKKKKIITVEDPVEYQLEGITQIQTHSEIGYTFARALRSILRQDPDVILIGEIRDKETAEIAIQASLTGHLVLSTLHTNDAISSFTRLIDMGIEPFLVATPVRAVMAQRLVRRLCPACSVSSEQLSVNSAIQEITEKVVRSLPPECKVALPNWRIPKGCPECQGIGYKGREGIYEMLPVTPEMQQLILSGGVQSRSAKILFRRSAKTERSGFSHPAGVQKLSDSSSLQKALHYRTLREDGLLKAWKGITSVEEVLRVTAE